MTVLHPWVHEARLAWPRVLREGAPRRGALAGVMALATAGAALRLGAAPVQQGIAHAPAQAALLCGALFVLAVRGPMRALAAQWRGGWMAALPVPRAAAPVTLGLLCAGAALFAMAWVAWSVASAQAVRLTACALAVAAALVWVEAVRGLRRRPVPPRRAGIRAPLFALPLVDSRAAPHLADWQRRAGIARWRRSGGAKMVGLCLALTPVGVSGGAFAGVLLAVLAGAWLREVLVAAHGATRHARGLLAPRGLTPAAFRDAALRYPAFACVCAAALAAAAALCAQSAWPAAVLPLLVLAGAPRACLAWLRLVAGRA